MCTYKGIEPSPAEKRESWVCTKELFTLSPLVPKARYVRPGA